MTDRDFKAFDPIVPESDERIGRGESTGNQPSSGRRKRVSNSPPRAAGSVGILWKILILVLLVALGGLGYLFMQEAARLATLQGRFDDLETKIVSTDESLNQSGAMLGIKLKNHDEELDKHWSEIKKLWGVSNDRNKKNIDAQGKSIKSLQASMAARKKETSTLAGKLDSLTNKLAKTTKSVETVASSSLAAKLEVNDMVSRSQDLVDQFNRLEQSLKASQQDLKTRIASTEEAIDAIDAYRRQVNRDIQQLKQQLGAPPITQ